MKTVALVLVTDFSETILDRVSEAIDQIHQHNHNHSPIMRFISVGVALVSLVFTVNLTFFGIR